MTPATAVPCPDVDGSCKNVVLLVTMSVLADAIAPENSALLTSIPVSTTATVIPEPVPLLL